MAGKSRRIQGRGGVLQLHLQPEVRSAPQTHRHLPVTTAAYELTEGVEKPGTDVP
jgi:hypothetical protein